MDTFNVFVNLFALGIFGSFRQGPSGRLLPLATPPAPEIFVWIFRKDPAGGLPSLPIPPRSFLFFRCAGDVLVSQFGAYVPKSVLIRCLYESVRGVPCPCSRLRSASRSAQRRAIGRGPPSGVSSTGNYHKELCKEDVQIIRAYLQLATRSRRTICALVPQYPVTLAAVQKGVPGEKKLSQIEREPHYAERSDFRAPLFHLVRLNVRPRA